jgi:hypothetical protein
MTIVTAMHAVPNRQWHSWARELAKRAYAGIDGRIKRRRALNARAELRSRMRKMTELAYIAVNEALNQHYGANEAVSERARIRYSEQARAGADYLFGKPHRDGDVDASDLAREKKAVRDWLVRNEPMKELVVHSLRVINATNQDRPKSGDIVGEGLLMAYGAGCHEALDLPAFEALVQRTIEALPPTVQQSVYYRWAMSQVHR